MMHRVIATSYLRVFQPVDTLQETERLRWERSIVQGEHQGPFRPVYRERRTSRRGRLGLLTAEDDRADVRLVEGRWYVCPWRTPLRVLASLLTVRETIPSEVAEALVPEADARRAARELARIRRRDPTAVPAMLQSAWHVPIRWFVLFDDQERRLVEREAGGFRLYYWTEVPEARARAQRAMRVLEGGGLEAVAEVVRDLDQWLSCFDRRCALELDYADVSESFGWNELDDDHSARLVAEALEALEEGDQERAGDIYQTVAGRWAEARIRESLN
jgi:hypothetical protein